MEHPLPTTPSGLSTIEVRIKRKTDGFNELPPPPPKKFITTLLEVIREPMLILLVVTATLYVFLGSIDEAAMLGAFVFVVIGITLVQERRTEHALEALQSLTTPKATVLRGGKQKTIESREIVTDDLIILNEGERVPADARLIQGQSLRIDESLITGESLPVEKSPYDGLDTIYSGSMVCEGNGIARVTSIGASTEIGKIGGSLKTIQREESHLRLEVSRIIRAFSLVAITVSCIVVVYYGLLKGEWIKGILASLALAMSLLPEEFPLILTIFLAIGAWRMTKRNVLARRSSVIETLGTTTVLCVDKTGTLTMNKLAVSLLATPSESYSSEEDWTTSRDKGLLALIESGLLGCRPTKPDPIETAIESFCSSYGDFQPQTRTLLREYPLSPKLLVRTQIWESKKGADRIVSAMGAPEAVLSLCSMDDETRKRTEERMAMHSGDGIRLIGIAKGSLSEHAELPSSIDGIALQFVGFIGLSDQIRPSVPAALRDCISAGIRVIMITGDHPQTAQAIADRIGLPSIDPPITGQDIDSFDPKTLRERIKTCSIFARVMPGQKLRIVEALQANGEIVAMTGDGVNDAPCLKAAHIGIAMGERGTDVAREAADLILLDDDFASIVQGVRYGRRIFDNIRKAFIYTFAVHIPIAGLAIVTVIFNWPLLLLPAHIALLELVIDPSCTMSFEAEPEEDDIMQRPPRPRDERIIRFSHLKTALIQGLAVLALTSYTFYFARWHGYGDNSARTLTYIALATANLFLILINLSQTRSLLRTIALAPKPFWWTVAGLATVLGAAILISPVRALFSFGAVDLLDLSLAMAVGCAGVLLVGHMRKADPRPAFQPIVQSDSIR